jgi:tyrosyl-tRNA synthetase
MEEIEKMREDMKNDKVNPMDLKKKLAFEITKIFSDEESAEKAQEDFANKFQKKDLSIEAEELKINKNENLIKILVENGLADSNGDARRKIQQGGVSVDGNKIELGDKVQEEWDGKILKIGKKDFRKIKIQN